MIPMKTLKMNEYVFEITDGKARESLNFDKSATQGYILTATNSGNGTQWSPVGLPTDEQTQEAVNAWLDEHPEASTTVQDGAVTVDKLAEDVKNDLVSLSYYEEITVEQEKIEGVDCYFVTIPLNDSNGDLIETYVGYSADLSPLEYAQENGTTLTTNNCISMKPADGTTPWLTGNIIGAGQVINSQNVNKELVCNGVGYLTISEDRQTIKDWPITTPLSTLQADSTVWNCMTYYCPLIKNGSQVDITGIVSNEGKAFATNTTGVGMFIGVKADKTIMIAGNDGRTDINPGILPMTVAEAMVDKGCTDVWLMDGGGSSNITLCGSKVNRNYDGGGTKDRVVHYTFNVKKPTAMESVTDIFAKIGEEKQNLIKQLFPAISLESDRFKTESGVDLNNISKTSAKYILHATNQPTTSDIGYCITIVRNSADGYLGNKLQYWTHYGEAFGLFVRKYYAGSWTGWKRFMPALSEGDEIATDISFYSGCTDGDKIYLTIPCGELYKSGNSTATWGTREDAGIIVFMGGSRIVIASPTIGFVRPQAHIGFYVRLDNLGTALTGDPNYSDKLMVGVSVRDLHITI